MRYFREKTGQFVGYLKYCLSLICDSTLTHEETNIIKFKEITGAGDRCKSCILLLCLAFEVESQTTGSLFINLNLQQ